MIASAIDNGTASPLVIVLITLLGGGGLAGSILAIFKIRPEASTAAVTQAQGAMETVVELNQILKMTLETERARTAKAEAERDQLLAMNKHLTEVIAGARIMADDVNFPPPPSLGERR